MAKFREYRSTHQALEQTRILVRDEPDEEMRAMARDEVAKLETDDARLFQELRLLLLPKDPRDDKDVFVEIRGGHRRRRSGLVRGPTCFACTRATPRTKGGRRSWWMRIARVSRGTRKSCSRSRAVAPFRE